MTLFAWCLAVVFAGLSAVHVYWAAGGRRGIEGAIPTLDGEPLFRPAPLATLFVAALLATAGMLILERAGASRKLVPALVSRWGTWCVSGALTLRAIGDFDYVGFFARRRDTQFARLDARCYSPLALALGLGAAVIAWRG